jgi:transposase-like protein
VPHKPAITRPRHTLSTTATYIKTRRAPRGFRELLAKISKTLDFPDERANRLKRFIEIIAAYQDGQPVAEIERDHGCTRSTILRYARIMGLPKRPKHFDIDRRQRVIRLYKHKVPVAEIARRCGCSQAYVSKTATEEGINRHRSTK